MFSPSEIVEFRAMYANIENMKDKTMNEIVLPMPPPEIFETLAEKNGIASIANLGGKNNHIGVWLRDGAERLPEPEDARHECYVVNVGALGLSAGYSGNAGRRRKPPPKDEIRGWSASSVKTLRRFLMSVRTAGLTGKGFAMTLTVGRVIPKTSKEFHDDLESLIQWFRYHGAIRWQWHIEWQERGAPHCHGMVYFPPDTKITADDVVAAWLKRVGRTDAKVRGQEVKPVSSAEGWLKYQAIHSVKGMGVAQRMAKNMPEGWETSGRMWGRGGDWDLQMDRHDLTCPEYHTFRRFVKRYVESQTRDENNKRAARKGLPPGTWLRSGRRAMRYARRLYRVPKTNERMTLDQKRGLAACRGLSLFLPWRISNALLAAAGFQEKPYRRLAASRSIYIARASCSMRFPPGWNLSIESKKILQINCR